MLIQARRILDDLAALEAPPARFEPEKACGKLTLAASDYSQAILAARLAAALHREAPALSLTIQPLIWDGIERRLETGDIDLAIVPRSDASAGLRSRWLFDDRSVCLMRKGHPAARQPLTLDAYCSLEHVQVMAGHRPLAGAIERALAAAGRSRVVSLTVPAFLIVEHIVRGSDMVATVPARLAALMQRELMSRPLPFETAPFGMALVWHPRHDRRPLLVWARARIAALLASRRTLSR